MIVPNPKRLATQIINLKGNEEDPAFKQAEGEEQSGETMMDQALKEVLDDLFQRNPLRFGKSLKDILSAKAGIGKP